MAACDLAFKSTTVIDNTYFTKGKALAVRSPSLDVGSTRGNVWKCAINAISTKKAINAVSAKKAVNAISTKNAIRAINVYLLRIYK